MLANRPLAGYVCRPMPCFERLAAAGPLILPAACCLALVSPFSRDPIRGRPVTDPPPQPAARVRLETDRTGYVPGDTIRAQLTVSHGGGPAVTLEFGTSQRCDFEIQDAAGTTVWRWSTDRAFAQMMSEEILGPGRPPLVCREQLPAPLSAGRYRLVGSVASGNRSMKAAVNVTVGTAISRP